MREETKDKIGRICFVIILGISFIIFAIYGPRPISSIDVYGLSPKERLELTQQLESLVAKAVLLTTVLILIPLSIKLTKILRVKRSR